MPGNSEVNVVAIMKIPKIRTRVRIVVRGKIAARERIIKSASLMIPD